MSRIRVLVVDDSAVVRRVVGEALAADPAIEVVGAAANGRIALAMLERDPVDVVTLDVAMPEMDGLQTLAALRRSDLRLPVIMYSATTARGAAVTMEALMLGANDYLAKPEMTSGTAEAARHVQDALLPKIKALADARRPIADRRSPIAAPIVTELPIAPDSGDVGARYEGRHGTATDRRSAIGDRRSHSSLPAVRIVVIGASTGGPDALAVLLPALPREFPVPIVVAQHMPPAFTGLLTANLGARAVLPVHEVVSGAVPEAGTVWIAPGDAHVLFEREGGRVVMLLDPCVDRPGHAAVDALFRSAAQVYGEGVLGIVLTGMGQDGLRGCEAIRRAGGRIHVQDRLSSVVWGMPGAVARAGLADAVLPLGAMADELVGCVLAEDVGSPSHSVDCPSPLTP